MAIYRKSAVHLGIPSSNDPSRPSTYRFHPRIPNNSSIRNPLAPELYRNSLAEKDCVGHSSINPKYHQFRSKESSNINRRSSKRSGGSCRRPILGNIARKSRRCAMRFDVVPGSFLYIPNISMGGSYHSPLRSKKWESVDMENTDQPPYSTHPQNSQQQLIIARLVLPRLVLPRTDRPRTDRPRPPPNSRLITA